MNQNILLFMIEKERRYLNRKYIKRIGNSILIFQTFRKVNIASYFYKKMSKSIFCRWLYIILPIIFYSINLLNMIANHVFYSEKNVYTYINDLSNSLGFTLLYFLSYFLSGYYPKIFDEWINYGLKKECFNDLSDYFRDRKYSLITLFIIGIILFIVGFMSGYFFYSNAKSNEKMFWIYNLCDFGRIYYCAFLGITWYRSLSLLGMAIFGGFTIFWSLRSQAIIYNTNDFNRNFSIVKMVDVLICTFSYGLFYIVGSFLFILNDKLAEKHFEVINTFYDDKNAFCLIFIVLCLVALVYVPLQELLRFMKQKKDELVLELNKSIKNQNDLTEKSIMIKKRNEIIASDLIYTSFANKLIVVISVAVPLVGVVLQGMALMKV